MQKRYSLKKNAQFKYVYRKGSSFGSKEMVLLYVKSNNLKVGFSVGKKLGCAVVRNRIKRRLRAVWTPYLLQMKKGLYVIIARKPICDASFDQLDKSVHYMLKRQNLLKEKTETTRERIVVEDETHPDGTDPVLS